MSQPEPFKPGVDDQQVISEAQATQAVGRAESERAKTAETLGAGKGKLSMRVRVHSPFREYFDGDAFSVTAENATGPFDILPHHHNFISLLLPCELILRTVDKKELKIRISGGIIHVKADKVIVFLDI